METPLCRRLAISASFSSPFHEWGQPSRAAGCGLGPSTKPHRRARASSAVQRSAALPPSTRENQPMTRESDSLAHPPTPPSHALTARRPHGFRRGSSITGRACILHRASCRRLAPALARLEAEAWSSELGIRCTGQPCPCPWGKCSNSAFRSGATFLRWLVEHLLEL